MSHLSLLIVLSVHDIILYKFINDLIRSIVAFANATVEYSFEYVFVSVCVYAQ